ncbi:MAG: cob(I)yrinic acid a,c-diamide adenosyltransferase [Clostridia bacterium]|nr:cob(I)yrinic acid a,c-diamide adenosyltransferase [Clostridia bacterium]MBQ8334132.1 cob(I)yrinic acid a,c-diamide adenosyltransferase [Clostridia bacterium]
MIHLYCGDGKGKTTAAVGLAVRAAGSGMRVLFVQFFKSGSSSEVEVLASVNGIETCHPTLHYGRFKTMTNDQKTNICTHYGELLNDIIRRADRYDLIVLDEVVSACSYGMIDADSLTEFLRMEGTRREIVLTGRNPLSELIELADYVTEMQKIKHPFDGGITARKGIEY